MRSAVLHDISRPVPGCGGPSVRNLCRRREDSAGRCVRVRSPFFRSPSSGELENGFVPSACSAGGGEADMPERAFSRARRRAFAPDTESRRGRTSSCRRACDSLPASSDVTLLCGFFITFVFDSAVRRTSVSGERSLPNEKFSLDKESGRVAPALARPLVGRQCGAGRMHRTGQRRSLLPHVLPRSGLGLFRPSADDGAVGVAGEFSGRRTGRALFLYAAPAALSVCSVAHRPSGGRLPVRRVARRCPFSSSTVSLPCPTGR